ncbi:MAG: DUF368 domain-containing protein [Lachnospiraceae bacterium]|nr:DUF368 domain-containing protein [Lachnospiraceae bacterium]
MIELIKLLVAGAFIGVATTISGLSGGVLMVSLGAYEKVVEALSNIFKGFKKNIAILFPLVVGVVLGYFLLNQLLTFTLANYPLVTVLFFCGIMFGGISIMHKKSGGDIKKISNLLILVLAFVAVLYLTFLLRVGPTVSLGELELVDYVMLLAMGGVIAVTLIIPGINTTSALLFFGYYAPIQDAIYALFQWEDVSRNVLILIPVLCGTIIGLGLIANLIRLLLSKCQAKVYFALLGVLLATLITIFIQVDISIEVGHIMIGALAAVVGFVGAVKLSD